MRIALIAPLELPLREPLAGPAERHVALLANGLSARGHAVTLYAGAGAGDGVAADVRVRRPQVDRRRSAAHRTAGGTEALYEKVCAEIADGAFDLVHDHSSHPTPWRRHSGLGAPTVHVLQDLPRRELADACRASGLGRAQVVVPSKHAAMQWAPYVGGATTIVNGVDLNQWRYSSRPVPGLCAYVGRVGEAEGVDLALEAARVAGHQMVVAGPVADEAFYRARVEPLLDRHRRYLGVLDTLATAQLLSNAECCLWAARGDEVGGHSLVESLACGTPVVGFDRGELGELVDGDTGILVSGGDTGAMAAAIGAVAELDRCSCRRRAAHLYSAVDMLDAYERVYAEALRVAPKRRVYSDVILSSSPGRGGFDIAQPLSRVAEGH